MDVSSVTVGLPVGDLAAATLWYRRVLELAEPDLEPADGVVEFEVGPVWLQLGSEPSGRSGAEVVLRLGVGDAASERERLRGLGVAVGPIEHVEGAVDYFDFVDPDGNRLSIYSLVPAGS
ncbi:VOC family protein [Cellulomonas triticagri]|uniref:VOC family protein n=1 Tax=Cellulomonas triticagri TaxID=2483352 RepID=A0A3M2JGL3_9CELL|nr:VOC family protein [Cellulomonas triticagri]RMI13177.1 VOC family protein [Cellulomonas triticagri]